MTGSVGTSTTTSRPTLHVGHLLRNLASVGVSFDQTEWTSSMAALLLEMKAAAATARAGSKKKISKRILADYLARYDTIVDEALNANPQPIGRKRDSIETEGYNLALAFDTKKDAISRFATDLRVGFTNYSDVAIMPKCA